MSEEPKTLTEDKNISILDEIILESKPDLIDIKKLEKPIPKNSFSSWFTLENPFFVHCKSSENEPISNKISEIKERKSYCFAQNEETILYFGGINEKEELLNTTFGFNKESSKFEELTCQGDIPEERSLLTGVFVDKNFVIFGGKGKDKLFNDIYILSNTLSWSLVKAEGEAPTPRFGHSSAVFDKKMIISGGFDGKNYLTDLYEFNFETSSWTTLKSEQKIPRAFHTLVLIENRFQILGGRNEHDKEVKKICFFPHKDLVHYESAQEKQVEELIDLQDLKKTFEALKTYWPAEEVNDLKYKMVRSIVEKEFRLFYQTPTEENLYFTTFMRYFQVFMSNFPLFEKTSQKEDEPDFAQLFLQFPLILVKCEQSFRKDFQKDLIDYIAALFNYIIKTPYEESLETIVKKNMTEEGMKTMLVKDDWSQEDKNLLNEIFKVDPLGKVYETIIETEKLKDLPERYQNVMKILTQKIMKFMRMNDDNPENLEKIKWINTLFSIIKPFMGVVNPLALLDKVIHIVLFSKIGRSGISLMLELSKTENEIKAHKEALKKQTKVLFNMDKWLLDKPFEEVIEIVKKWDKPVEKKTEEKKEDKKGSEYKIEVKKEEKKELPPVPHSKKLPEVPQKRTESSKHLLPEIPTQRKGSLNTIELEQSKLNSNVSPREKELPPVPKKNEKKEKKVVDIELFKPYFLNEINKRDETGYALKDEEIGHCKEYLYKSVRLTQKKDFLRFLDDTQVQKLIKTSLKVTMVPMMRLYAHTDVGRVAGTLITASQQFVLLLESDAKAKKDLANMKEGKKEEFEKKIHQEWETKFLKIAHTIQNEIYYVIHEIFCKDQKSNNTIGKLTQWVNDMITEVGTKQLLFEEIYYKSSLEERDRIFLEECHYLFFKTKNIPKREVKKEVKKFSSTDFIKGNQSTNSPKDKFLPPTPTKK